MVKRMLRIPFPFPDEAGAYSVPPPTLCCFIELCIPQSTPPTSETSHLLALPAEGKVELLPPFIGPLPGIPSLV